MSRDAIDPRRLDRDSDPRRFFGDGRVRDRDVIDPKEIQTIPLTTRSPTGFNARKFVSLLIRKIWCSKIKEETNYHKVVFNLYAPLGVL